MTDGHLVLGATGGYLVGFVVASGIVGRLAELGWDRRFGGALLAMAIGNLVIYLVGVPWLMAATGLDLAKAFSAGVGRSWSATSSSWPWRPGVFPIAWWVVGRNTEER